MDASSSTPTAGLPQIVKKRGGRGVHAAILVGMAVLLVAGIIFSLGLGRYGISPLEVVSTLWAHFTGAAPADDIVHTVIFNVRLPRILMAVLIGAGLAVAGATYQAVFGNPLVSSDILGVSSGAAFGASLGILVSGGALMIEGLALGFGLVAVGLVMLLGRVQRRTQLYMLVLAGVVVGALFDSFVSFIKYVADPYEKLPEITVWLMGSLASSTYEDLIKASVVILPCCALLIGLRWQLNLLSLDEDEARSLGVNVARLRLVAIVIATVITAVAVSLCGVIGWIGLVIPHIVRFLLGNDHRTLIPGTILLGGTYLLLIDDLARCLTAAEIPLSILTAVIGAPFFAWLLRRSGKGAK